MSKVAVIMGSASDKSVAKAVCDVLADYGVPYDVRVLSAHRTPDLTAAYVSECDCDVFIAIAGMAAHLAGAVAANTIKPVIAVPVLCEGGGGVSGVDALLSSVMMPPGVPVATVAVGAGYNAALLAVQILAVGGGLELTGKLHVAREKMREKVIAADAQVRGEL